MIQAIWRLFSVCSKPTQIKCLKHLIVGERALVALERAMGNCSGEKTVCDSQCDYWIIYYRTSNKHCRFNGAITKMHLSRKHNKHKASSWRSTCGGAAPEWRRGLWWAESRAESGCHCCGEGAWPRCCVKGCPSVKETALAELSSSETHAPAVLHLSWTLRGKLLDEVLKLIHVNQNAWNHCILIMIQSNMVHVAWAVFYAN